MKAHMNLWGIRKALPRKGFLLSVTILVTAWTGGGCSMRRLAVDNYEWLATRGAASFADLSSEQKEKFRSDLQTLSQTVRDRHLAGVLVALKDLPEGRDKSSVAVSIATLAGQFRAVMSDACQTFAPLMAELDPTQIDHIQSKLAERNEKYDPAQNGGIDAWRKERKRQAKMNAEEWFGPLNAAQLALIDQDSLETTADGRSWESRYLAYRVESQEAFLRILRSGKGNPGAIEKNCRSFVARPDDFLSADGRKARAMTGARRDEIGPAMLTSLDESQRSHFRKEIARLIADINSWSEHIKKQ